MTTYDRETIVRDALLRRISDDIEAVIRHVERLQRDDRDPPDLNAAWIVLNDMRVYVNEALPAPAGET